MSITRREIPTALLATLFVTGLIGRDHVALADSGDDESFEPRRDLPPALLINIRTFFGSIMGNYFIDNHNLDRVYLTYAQFKTAFAVPGENSDIGDGLRLISGNKYREGGLQAAVVANASNDVLAAALVHQNCRREGFIYQYPGTDPITALCAPNLVSTIFVGLETDAALKATAALKMWAHVALERERSMTPGDPNNSKTDVIDVVHLR